MWVPRETNKEANSLAKGMRSSSIQTSGPTSIRSSSTGTPSDLGRKAETPIKHDRKTGQSRNTSCAWRTPCKRATHSETTSLRPFTGDRPMSCCSRGEGPHEIACVVEFNRVSMCTQVLQVSKRLRVHLTPSLTSVTELSTQQSGSHVPAVASIVK